MLAFRCILIFLFAWSKVGQDALEQFQSLLLDAGIYDDSAEHLNLSDITSALLSLVGSLLMD